VVAQGSLHNALRVIHLPAPLPAHCVCRAF
jgi:hypothetical protein